jgi:hypothetical protein
VIADCETELELNNLKIPVTLAVVQDLGYDLIIGMDVLRQTQAVLDVETNTLTLYGGLTAVPMTTAGACAPVVAAIGVEIPPMSEAVFPVEVKAKLPDGNFLIEAAPENTCRSLMVARTLVRAPATNFACRVLNRTKRTLKLTAGAAVGVITSVQPIEPIKQNKPNAENEPPLQEQRKLLEEKGISLADTAFTGQDLDDLIRFLYRNRDLMATSVEELPGTDILMHRIDTGAHPPVRKRAFRHSPADRAEISRQTQEMLRGGIIEESDSPWSSPVLLVTKKDGTKRFCVDYRGVNASTALTSWPLSTLEEVLDSISESGAKFYSNCDLRAGYWQVALDPQTVDRTGFQTHEASFIFKRLPFGLCNAVQMFSALMQRVMKGLPASTVLVYLDDILIMGKDPPTC